MKQNKGGKPRKKWIAVLVNTVLVAGLLGTGWKIADELLQQKQSADLAESLWERVTRSQGERKQEESRTEPSAPAQTGRNSPESSAATPAPTQTDRNRSEPGTETPAPVQTDRSRSEPGTELKEEAGTQTVEAPSTKQASAAEQTENEKEEEHPSASGLESMGTGEETLRPDRMASETEEKNKPESDSRQTEMSTPAGGMEAMKTPSAEGPAEEPEDPLIPKRIDFEPLWAVSKNAKAWLYSPDTGLSQVVAQAKDNEYYLKHLLDGSFNVAGTLFIDSRNRGDFTDRNTIIYGHNMRNKSMFGRLIEYGDAEYCREHPFLYLYTPGNRFRLEVVASFGARDDSPYYTLPVGWAQWEMMLKKGKEKTAWDFEISCSENDHFVTLSTCAYAVKQERWLLIARIDDPEAVLDLSGDGK